MNKKWKLHRSETSYYTKGGITATFSLLKKFLEDVYSYVKYFQSTNTELYFFLSNEESSLVLQHIFKWENSLVTKYLESRALKKKKKKTHIHTYAFGIKGWICVIKRTIFYHNMYMVFELEKNSTKTTREFSFHYKTWT